MAKTKYRITVKPSSLPNEGEWEFEVTKKAGRHSPERTIAQGYATSKQYAIDAARATAARDAHNLPHVEELTI